MQTKIKNVPRYKQIEQDIRNRVLTGRLGAGVMLPSRRRLAEEYAVGLPTLEHAIDLLISDGTLRSDDRRGTFVSETAFATFPAGTTVADAYAYGGRDHAGHGGDALAAVPQNTGTGGDAPRSNQTIHVALVGANAPLSMSQSPFPGQPLVWTNAVVRAMEASIGEAGGSTSIFPRYAAEGRAFDISLEEALRRLPEETTATAVAVVNVNDYPPIADAVLASRLMDRMPVVLVSYDDAVGLVPFTSFDNRTAGYRAAKHLLSSGYAPCVYLAAAGFPWSDERRIGVDAALRETSLPDPKVLSIASSGQYSSERVADREGWEAVREFFVTSDLFAGANGARPREDGADPGMDAEGRLPGFIAANDRIAIGVLEVAKGLGIIPGKDFGLIGFDDDPQSAFYGLTTQHPPFTAMGEEAARILIAQLQGKSAVQQVQLRWRLIARASTRRE